ncbi:MAG: AAA family ATPase, partial [Bacteroidales bacterium]
MLRSLQIENYALIRSLNIDFDNGFTVITGETGAGKSIILGALSLILGNRADTAVLFDTSKKCFVEAHFDLTYFDLSAFFNEYDLDYENDTVVRREVNEKGKSRAFINDTPVTLLVLKEFASCLIDIHSQHHNLLFNNASYRLYVVDQFANNQTLVNQYNTKFQQWKKVEKECQELKEKQQRSLQEKDFLNYILQELENAAMYIGEQEEIEEKIAILSNAELIKSKLYQSVQLLSEEEQNVLQQLKELKGHIGAIISCNVAFQQYDQRIENTILELKDLAYDISKKELEIEVNPQMLQTLSERMDLLFSLQQKHHANSIEELLQQLENIREQLSLMTDESQRLELLENKRKTLYLEASQLAQTIS